MGCHSVSSRLITIRLKAVPFNITVVQTYVPTSDYHNNEIEQFYNQLQKETAAQSLKKGKSAGIDNIPAELVQTRGKDVITALTTICNKIM